MSDLCVHSSDLKLMLFDHLSYNLPCNHHLSIIPRPSFMRKYSRLSGVTALQSASSEEGSPWWKESSVIRFQWLSNSSKLFIIITMTISQLSPPWQSLPRLMWTALTSCCPVLLSCRLNWWLWWGMRMRMCFGEKDVLHLRVLLAFQWLRLWVFPPASPECKGENNWTGLWTPTMLWSFYNRPFQCFTLHHLAPFSSIRWLSKIGFSIQWLEKCSTWPGNQSLGKTEEMSRPREQIQAGGWFHSWSEPSWTGNRHLMTSLSTSNHIHSMSPHIYHNTTSLSPERSHWHGRWHTGRVFLGNARDGSPNIWR